MHARYFLSCLGILLLLSAGAVSAQTLTWGANGAGGSGTWDAGTTIDWYNGSSNVGWTNGDAAVFAGSAGNVSISGVVAASQLTFNTAGYLLQSGFLDGTSNGLTVQTNADATISSAIFGAGVSGSTGFTKSGTGALILSGVSNPVFFGSITVADGELRYGNGLLNNTTAYVLGNTAAAALTFSNTMASIGSLAGGGTAGGVVRPSGTSGSYTLSINDNSADATYAGTFAGNGNATLSLQKGGTATQTLTAASFSLMGAVTVNGGRLALAGANGALPNISGLSVNTGGTFQLDNSAAVNQTRLATGLAVTLNGGTVSFVGNTASQDVHQTVGALNVASGASAVSVTSAGSGVSQLIFSGALARTSGATVSFTGGSHITLAASNDPTGILGGYATVGADWAALDTNANVVAYTGYASDTTTASNADNLRVTTAGGTVSLAGVTGRNSLNLVNTTGATNATLDLGANGSPVLASGGLLTSGSAGFVIQNGKIASGTGELVVTNQAALTISSVINSAVTKSGAGTLVLTGANTYTGNTTINQGTVQVAADANLGNGSAVALDGGTLQATAGFTSTKSLQGTAGGTVDTGSNTVAFTGKTNTGSFTKVGAGILSLTGTVGSITVNAGTLQLVNLTGTTTSSVTLNNARLEAGPNGLQTVTTLGTSPVVSPGPHGQAQELDIASFTVLGQTVVDFDLGSAGSDFLSVSTNLSLSTGINPALLFRFNNLGGIQAGTAYPLLRLPSSQLALFNTGEFGLDSVSTAAGYRGTFTIVGGTVDVTFSAVPEPSALAACLLVGALAGWGVRRRLSARFPSP